MSIARTRSPGQLLCLGLLAVGVCSSLTGCVVVGASSRGGFFIWPGGLGLLLVLALLFFVLRRR